MLADNYIKIGDIIEYEGLWFKVLGYSASKDKDGKYYLEIDWDDYTAVSEQDVKLKARYGTYI